jgi:hypothetical protein
MAAVIDDPERFKATWLAMIDERDQQQRERENQIRLLNEDPFNADAQKKIEEIIRQEKIQENLQYAYENNPAGRINSVLKGELYANIKIQCLLKSPCSTYLSSLTDIPSKPLLTLAPNQQSCLRTVLRLVV